MQPVTRFISRVVGRLVVLSIACAIGLAAGQAPPPGTGPADHASRLEHEVSFHIPSGSLESALIQFSRQAGIQVIINAEVAEISVAAVERRLSARAALSTLLHGTGLAYTLIGSTVTIRSPTTQVGPEATSAIATSQP